MITGRATAHNLADQAIGLFIEYRDVHGYDEPAARASAVLEVAEGASVDLPGDPVEASPGPGDAARLAAIREVFGPLRLGAGRPAVRARAHRDDRGDRAVRTPGRGEHPPTVAVPPAAAALPRPGPETWRAVEDWPGYQVSDLGRVRSVDRTLPNGRFCAGTVLRQQADRKGYRTVNLRKGGKSSAKRVHVLVMLAFEGRRPAGMQILHKDDDRSRNDLESLRYGTGKQNVRERTRRERRERGKRRRGREEQKGRKRVTGEIGRGAYRDGSAAPGAAP